jgi:hypothetical protein
MAESIKELLEARHFVPFTVHQPDRPPMHVPHPDFAHLSPKGKTIHIWVANGEGFRILDVALITDLEPDQQGRQS